MEVIDGSFRNADGTSFTVAPGFLEGDWGSSAIGWVGDPMQPAPDSLEVRWFSYPEDKFYHGKFLLPQQRLYDLLKQGYWNTSEKKQETYDELTLCLLPKGVVVVWLTGQNQVLIGRYQGQEIHYDFKRFNPGANRARLLVQEHAKLPAHVQAEINSHTLSTKRWDTYLKTYSWHLTFSQPLTLLDYRVSYFNAEATTYPLTPDLATYAKAMLETQPRPVPNRLLVTLDAGYGRKRGVKATLDEAETLAAFQTLHAASPSLPLALCLDTDERVSKVRVCLQNARQQVALAKAKVEVYDAK